MSNERWEPVEDGEVFDCDGDTISVHDELLSLVLLDGAGPDVEVCTFLPDDLRLCRRVPDNRPRPDWSQAPVWAMWWAVNASFRSGHYHWFENQPHLTGTYWSVRSGEWSPYPDGAVEIPLGIDWRTLIEKRPEAE